MAAGGLRQAQVELVAEEVTLAPEDPLDGRSGELAEVVAELDRGASINAEAASRSGGKRTDAAFPARQARFSSSVRVRSVESVMIILR